LLFAGRFAILALLMPPLCNVVRRYPVEGKDSLRRAAADPLGSARSFFI
jgi:hypothetical protein